MTDDENLSELEAALIQPGWEVYSNDGERVGTVRSVEGHHFEMELDVLGGTTIAVPLREVEAADEGRVELDVPAEQVGLMGWEELPGDEA
jgi:hypothetical protein